MKPQSKYKTLLGVGAVTAASILFGGGYALGDIVSGSGMAKTCNEFWVSLIIIFYGVIYCFIRKEKVFRRISRTQLALCILCGVCIWCNNVLFLIAYQYISVTEVTMLHFLHPSLVAVFMTLVFKERFSIYKLIAICCSIAALLLLTGKGTASGSVIGIIAALSTGIFYGAYPIILEVSPLNTVAGETVIIYLNITKAILAAVVSLVTGNFMLPISQTVFVVNIAQSTTGFAAYLLTNLAVRNLGATNASFGAMLEPIVSCIIAAVFLHETMEISVLYAGVLVLLSVFFCSRNPRSAGTVKLTEKEYTTRPKGT